MKRHCCVPARRASRPAARGPANASRQVLNLHWRGDKAANYKVFPAALTGPGDALHPISQPSSSEGFCWDDHEQAIRDVEGLLGASLPSLDAIIGSSQGGVIVLKLADRYSLPYFGVIPAFLNGVYAFIQTRWEIPILIGTADRFYGAAATWKELAKGGVDVKLVTMADAGHFFLRFPTYFNPIMEELLTLTTGQPGSAKFRREPGIIHGHCVFAPSNRKAGRQTPVCGL